MIEIKNLIKRYDKRIIFDNYSLVINDNELVAIVGKSGSGKSTLLNMIGLLDGDYDGKIIIDNQDIKMLKGNKRTKYIRDNISYLYQNYALIEDMSIEENLLMALEYTKYSKSEKVNKIKEILSEVGISNDIKDKIYLLSGGEQQRVALARCLLKPSKYILADEPTGNLDEKNRNEVIRIIKQIRNQGKTVIIVTHDDYVAEQCEKIIQL